jgi:RimJ/RimL family protein N-acetyltransferase
VLADGFVRLEIGRPCYGATARRSAINTTAKRFLLAHAFETLGLHRVEIRTDSRNARSRTAIERIGATFEGIMRRNVVMSDGYIRDTACYAITDLDRPQVRSVILSLSKDGLVEMAHPSTGSG